MAYYLSLCCIIKNESNLEEFIIYHYILGIEHFFIYDNESDKPIKERLNTYFFNKICTIINLKGKYKQLEAYENCLKTYGTKTEWLIIIDGDEYILPIENIKLNKFLEKYDKYQAIGINWIIYGTSYHKKKQDGYLVDKYRRCVLKQNKHIKTICKPKYCKIDNPHNVITNDPNKYVDPKYNIISGPFNENYTIDVIRINHYFSKSEEECYEKYNRGNADSENKIDLNDRLSHGNNLNFDNTLPDRYLETIKKYVIMIYSNWKIYKILNQDLLHLNEIEINEHAIKYGIHENRNFHIWQKYPEYNKNDYIKKNIHLEKLSDTEIEEHYIINHS
jgi:hypothetical protein